MATLLYNPDRKDRQEFLDEFVIRTRIFDDIFNDIIKAKMKYPEQHYMLLGQRGAGKTTLLLRLKYAVEDDPKLSKWLIPVMFSEEQYHISEVVNIWEHVAAYLEDHHNFFGLCSEMEQFAGETDFEATAFDILVKHLDKHKKKLVLFIDNVGDLLKKLNQLEIFRLREILQTKPHLRLIAASSAILDGILDYQQPFFEFFKMIQLKGLTYDESTALLKKLAALHKETEKIDRIINESPSRIETLRTLSGGVPRTIALLFQVFVDNEHGDAVNDLEKILDAVTPLYKHRMDDLPPQQQKIVDAVARNWEAVSVKQLAERLRLESKVISSQLRQLEKNQVIEKRTTDTKNHIYLLRERFFNIWYLMRYGRKDDRQRVIWLVKFLEIWCDHAEIEKRIDNYIQKVNKGTFDEHTKAFFAQVYSYFKEIKPQTKFRLMESAPDYTSGHIHLNDEEFDTLFKEYLYKKDDWSPFLKLVSRKHDLKHSQIQELYDVLTDGEYILKIEQAIESHQFSLETDAELFILMGYYHWMLVSFAKHEDIVNKMADIFTRIASLVMESRRFDIFKTGFFTSFGLALLINGYTQLAASLVHTLSEKYGDYFENKIKIFHYVVLYFVNIDKGKDITETLGSEMRIPVQDMIDYVMNARRRNGI